MTAPMRKINAPSSTSRRENCYTKTTFLPQEPNFVLLEVDRSSHTFERYKCQGHRKLQMPAREEETGMIIYDKSCYFNLQSL